MFELKEYFSTSSMLWVSMMSQKENYEVLRIKTLHIQYTKICIVNKYSNKLHVSLSEFLLLLLIQVSKKRIKERHCLSLEWLYKLA